MSERQREREKDREREGWLEIGGGRERHTQRETEIENVFVCQSLLSTSNDRQ